MSFKVCSRTGLLIWHDGVEDRILAALPNTRARNFKRLMSSRVIPQSDWVEFDNEAFIGSVLDQNGRGACVGHGSCSAFTGAWNIAAGTRHDFSPWYLYSGIDGGSDNGAMVGDAAEYLQKNGICLFSSVPYGTYRENEISSTAKTEAQRFRAKDVWSLQSIEEIYTGALYFGAVSIGIEIGNSFDPDSNGILPEMRGGGGGHCMCVCGAKKINGKWYFKVRNSWAIKWGLQGNCFMPMSYYQGQTDHWAVECVLDDPSDPLVAPDPKA